MLLTGSFREYPFPLLLEIFLRRRETGLLEVSSTDESGFFYIKNGKVKDGQIGKKKGLAAIKRVGKLDEGLFRFKPLEPTDYARVIWQRSFGPNTLTDPTPIPVASVENRFHQLKSYPAAAFRITEQAIASSAQSALRQVRLYKPAPRHGSERNGANLRVKILAAATAAFGLLKRAQSVSSAAVENRLRRFSAYSAEAYRTSVQVLQLKIHAAATAAFGLLKRAQHVSSAAGGNGLRRFSVYSTDAYDTSEQALRSFAERARPQLLQFVSAAEASFKNSGRSLLRQTTRAASTASSTWKSAEVGTRLARLSHNGLDQWQSALRRDRQRIITYARGFSFEPPVITLPPKETIVSSLRRLPENNIIFALIILVLGAASALCVYQLFGAEQDQDEGIVIDEHFETEIAPAKVPPPREKRKQRRTRKPSSDRKSNAMRRSVILRSAPNELSNLGVVPTDPCRTLGKRSLQETTRDSYVLNPEESYPTRICDERT